MAQAIGDGTLVERVYRADLAEMWGLWATAQGFASWWGPEQFRVEVMAWDGAAGGALRYDMIADTQEARSAMEAMGAPIRQPCHGVFSAWEPQRRIALTQVIDFLPDVEPYQSVIAAEFSALDAGRVRMVVSLGAMHDAATTAMQRDGFLSQLSKLDLRYGAV